ncbi:unnamed protein product [Dovyalis caffra]|uniref:MTHFR SAM-binding regulatory domain-containing protein n=1 Tax=Dovyalis caffra TaxID=77055 RepID=A0AAV1RRW9_9ROSI|nr:unnamed protein product [Dovyalis caffra]
MFIQYSSTQLISNGILMKANCPKSYLSRTIGWDKYPHGGWGDSRNPSYGASSDYQFLRPQASGKKLLQEWVVPLRSVEDINEDKGENGPHVVCLSMIMEGTDDISDSINPCLQRRAGWGDKMNALGDKCKAFPFVTHMAVNKGGSWISNVALTDVNASFPAKEIIQPTVMDPTSFSVWKDEAFEIWSRVWASLYPEGDPSRTLLQEVLSTEFMKTRRRRISAWASEADVLDLINPPAELEKRTHKLKRLVQFPNSFFMDAKLSKANQELFYMMSPPYFQVSLKLRQCDHLTVAICISNRGALSGRRDDDEWNGGYASEGARNLTPKVGSHTGSCWDPSGLLS